MHERFEGIVLFKRLHRENDGLVKIFTDHYGTKMFFVKGLEKANHPYRSQLLPITLNQYVGTINETGLSFIKEAHSLSIYRGIQTDYLKQAYASYIVQLTDAAISDNTPAKELYSFFKEVLKQINADFAPDIMTIYTEIYLLKYFGLALEFNQCRICGSTEQPFDFSINHQGVLCRKHWQEDSFRLRVNPKAMYIASRLALTPIHLLQSVKASPATTKELRRLMDEIYQEFVGLRLKSKSYLDQLDAMDESIQKMQAKRQEPN